MKSRRDIRRFFSRYYLILIVLPLIITGIIISVQTFRASLVDVRELQSSHAQAVSTRIVDHFSDLSTALLDAVDFQNIGEQTTQEQQFSLALLLFYNDSLMKTGLFDMSGREYFQITAAQFEEANLPPIEFASGSNSDDEEGPETSYSEIKFYGTPQRPYLIVTIPIIDEATDQETFQLGAMVGFDEVRAILRQVEFKNTGYAYLLNGEGRLIASPDPNSDAIGRLHHVPTADEELDINQPIGLVRNLLSTSSIRVHNEFMLGDQLFYAVTELPTVEALFLTGNVMLIVAALIVFTLLSSVLFQILLRQRVIRPIESLYAASVNVREGDLSQRVAISGSYQMSTLGQEFNAMVERLESSFEEEKVRSDELEELNRALQAEIDERERAESALDQIFSLSQDLIGVLNLSGQLEIVNPAFASVLGYSESTLKQKNFVDLVPDDDREIIRSALRDLAKGRRLAHFDTRIENADGSISWFDMNAQRLDPDKKIFVVARDITTLKGNEERLQELLYELGKSNEELERFAYIVSHDLQEPLRKIQTFGERLEALLEGELSEKGSLYLEKMSNSASRLQRLINDLLTYSRVSSREFERAPVNLGEVVNEVLSDLVVQLEECSGVVEVDELPTISGNPTFMRLLFQNLISNGLKFHKADEHPVITISSEKLSQSRDGDLIYRILVRDNGIGFESDESEQIFDVFKRLHGREEYDGTGIGLAICKKIVENHGGKITAEAEPGSGATFAIELPAAADDRRGDQQNWSVE